MNEIIQRLRHSPAAALRLFLAALIINVLGLAVSLYAIQVLNRFVSYGVTGTLVTMTAGVLIAMVGEHLFRTIRFDLAREMVEQTDDRLAKGVYGLFLTARYAALDEIPQARRQHLIRGLEQASAVLGPSGLTALSDIPFSLIFLSIITLVSWPMGMIVGGFALVTAWLVWQPRREQEKAARTLRGIHALVANLVTLTDVAAETIRQFGGVPLLLGRWEATWNQLHQCREELNREQAIGASHIQLIQAGMVVAIYALGSLLVVEGLLNIGLLIGINLMANRTLQPLTRILQMRQGLRQADRELAEARQLAQSITSEPERGTVLHDIHGELELRAVACRWPDAPAPLFSGVSLRLPPGGVLVVTGPNGSGKSTLLRLLCGLREPDDGQILVDGVELRQISLSWWRNQISYLPQEPVFFDGTLRENLEAARPGIDVARMRKCLEQAGMTRWLDRQPQGWELVLHHDGHDLSPGLRRRLAMARALAMEGSFVFLDEPTEGLDREGCDALYAVMIALAKAGKTIVVTSHDANILRGASQVLDLGQLAGVTGSVAQSISGHG
ncbi:MAG: ATP-binding cassette domain-containing protein [Magnetococcales bacterium]|nr:ATP-binding cassette domain-containing protein [Magnetococcales bacterium]